MEVVNADGHKFDVFVRFAESPQFGERIQTDVEMMRQALAEVRALGVAFESFAADNNRYPTAAIADDNDRTVGGFALQEVRRLPGDVFKIYTRMLPKRDPWESPYLFWSDGQHYAVICLGADGSVARSAQLADLLVLIKKGEDIESTSSYCLEDEIVFANGAFVWWPKNTVRRCGEYAARDLQTPPHRAH
jgi:hypothetical protein